MIAKAAHGAMPPRPAVGTWTSWITPLVSNLAISTLILVALAMLGAWAIHLRSIWRFVIELAVSSSKFCLDVFEAWMTH